MELETIEDIRSREFGFMQNGPTGVYMKRHATFSDADALRAYIERWEPVGCYVSVARYDDPATMSGWRGADLFFDIDSEDRIPLAQAQAHTVYESLLDDFGLEEVSLRFSGAKGYHVIATDERPRILDSACRREMVYYFQAKYGVTCIDAPASCDTRRIRRIAGTRNAKSGRFCELVR